MIKIGIIGMGIRGTMFADTIRENPYAEIAAVSEYNEETLQVAVDKYQVAGYQDYIKMMDEVEMDGVIVSTPDFLHKDAVVYAANKGIHILCEKPFSTSVAECEEMVAAIQKNKVKCLVAFENRWNSPVVAAKNNIDSGSVGEILNVNARLNDTIFVPTELLKWSKGSSVGWFLFPHLVDMIAWFSGKTVESVYAVGTKKKLVSMGIDLYDTIQATLNYTDGTHSTLSSSWVLPNSMPMIYDMKLEVIGTEGALYIDTNDQMVRLGSDRYSHVHTLGTSINNMATGNSNFMLHYFVDCIRKDIAPEANELAGLENTKIVEAIHKSVETGEVVKID
ncbi:MAG: Gfo/Idh/MocA family protein [Anaerovoracaceae bacterium]|jgi:predicted dehydrogenase